MEIEGIDFKNLPPDSEKWLRGELEMSLAIKGVAKPLSKRERGLCAYFFGRGHQIGYGHAKYVEGGK